MQPPLEQSLRSQRSDAGDELGGSDEWFTTVSSASGTAGSTSQSVVDWSATAW